MSLAVNSLAYWNSRFAGDWDELLGRRQSRFFGQLARALWPSWLADRVKCGGLKLCDWGCALGDGTVELLPLFGGLVTGVDFSEVAIKKAIRYHPECRFVARDWLSHSTAEDDDFFDVVFSSNTLEHFIDPWAVFKVLAARSRAYIVLLLPFDEPINAMNAEHLTRFDRSSIRICPMAGWVLCDAAVSDLGPSPFWPGKQVLLVYGRDSELAELPFFDSYSRQSRLLSDLESQVQSDALVEITRQRDIASNSLTEVVGLYHALMLEHRQLLDSRTWRFTEPFRRWASKWNT